MKFESMRWTGRIKHLQCGLWTVDDVGVCEAAEEVVFLKQILRDCCRF